MLTEVLEALAPKKGEVVLDATVGQGGHSAALMARGVQLIALDADREAVAAVEKRLRKAKVIEGNFADLPEIFKREGIRAIDKALFDLGWNRGQLVSGRGFSFQTDEPLSMSYGRFPRSGFTAADILNTWSEKGIADALFGYGEEQYARRIARSVVERRQVVPITTSVELAELVKDSVPARYRHGRLHPATKTFQALRIAVNDELGVIEQGLHGAWSVLKPGGRIAVITFHSVEDRLVKNLFRSLLKHGGVLVTKKPLAPSAAEIKKNPAARSAKLRVIEKYASSRI